MFLRSIEIHLNVINLFDAVMIIILYLIWFDLKWYITRHHHMCQISFFSFPSLIFYSITFLSFIWFDLIWLIIFIIIIIIIISHSFHFISFDWLMNDSFYLIDWLISHTHIYIDTNTHTLFLLFLYGWMDGCGWMSRCLFDVCVCVDGYLHDCGCMCPSLSIYI